MYEKNVDNFSGLCPDWDSWDQTKPVDNAREAMQQADEWLGVPQVTNFPIVRLILLNVRAKTIP